MIADALGPYRLRTRLGSGGMGEVWLAERDGRPVALKILHWHLLSHPPFVERFLREGEIGVRISSPNVARTLDVGSLEHDGLAVHYLAMEYVEGRTLRSLLDELGRLPESLCRHVALEVARGLGAIHAAGAIHRDVKPENVLLTRDRQVKLTDLGVARDADDVRRLSSVGTFVGTVAYAAPEQFRTRDLDGRADLYALGISLYETACGAHPFAEGEATDIVQRHLSQEPRRLGERCPQTSAFFEALVHTLLVKDRAHRFPSARELIAVLETGEQSVWWRNRVRTLRGETRGAPRTARAPDVCGFVGREDEIAALRAAWAEARRGAGGVVVVEGEDGVGRTRLVREFADALRREGVGAEVLYGVSPPRDAVSAAGAFVTAFRERFGDDPEAVRSSFRHLPELGEGVAALLRADAPVSEAPHLTREALRAAFVHAAQMLAGERALVVVIDDLHRAPDETRELFASLALGVRGRPILLVGTTTPGLDLLPSAGAGASSYARVTLAPLPEADIARLLSTLRDADGAPCAAGDERAVARIVAVARGSPRRAMACVRADRASSQSGQPDADAAADPDGALIRALGGGDRAALEAAACCGLEFDATVVARAVGVTALALMERLRHLERTVGCVRAVGPRFAFADGASRDALLDLVPASRLREWHGALAAALEERPGAGRSEPAALPAALCVALAEHAVRAGDAARAARYVPPAFAYLVSRHAHDRAVRLAESVLGGTPPDAPEARLELLLAVATSRMELGRDAEAAAALDEAERVASAASDVRLRAKVALARAARALRRDDASTAAASAADAAADAAAAGDGSLRLRADCAHASALRALGRDEEADALARGVLEAATKAGDPVLESDARTILGALAAARGSVKAAREEAVRRAALARQSGNRAEEASALVEEGDLLFRLGRPVEARAVLERGEALADSVGEQRLAAAAALRLGEALWFSGDVAGALDANERRLELARASGDLESEAASRADAAALLARVGDVVASRIHADAALVAARAVGDRGIALAALVVRATLAAEAGDRDATDTAARAVALGRELRATTMLARALLVLGDEQARKGDAADAARLLDEAYFTARSARGASLAPLVAAALAEVDPSRAPHAEAERARAGASLAMADRMEMRYRLWRATGDARHLAESKRLLDHLAARAPERNRGTIASGLRLHRAIVSDAAREGVT